VNSIEDEKNIQYLKTRWRDAHRQMRSNKQRSQIEVTEIIRCTSATNLYFKIPMCDHSVMFAFVKYVQDDGHNVNIGPVGHLRPSDPTHVYGYAELKRPTVQSNTDDETEGWDDRVDIAAKTVKLRRDLRTQDKRMLYILICLILVSISALYYTISTFKTDYGVTLDSTINWALETHAPTQPYIYE